MTGAERRQKILLLLEQSEAPVNGEFLSGHLAVSRQVIVQDIALLRANGVRIVSTNRGYVLEEKKEKPARPLRVFKVIHTDGQAEDELNLFVDMGATVVDVFVYHKIYGVIKAGMDLKSRRDVGNYMRDLHSGKSGQLKNVTGGYHYHTVEADSEEILDLIQEKLGEKGYLASLQDYEPVNFWKE